MSKCDTSVSLVYKDAAAVIASHVYDGAQEADGWAAMPPPWKGRALVWICHWWSVIILPNFQEKINYNPC